MINTYTIKRVITLESGFTTTLAATIDATTEEQATEIFNVNILSNFKLRMRTSKKGLDIIKQFEGFSLTAYLDSVGVPTIGWGTITYPNGKRVKMGDKITLPQAEEYLQFKVKEFEGVLNKVLKTQLTQNQFDALSSFTYNLGGPAITSSTLLRKVNTKSTDPLIRKEFMRWVNAGGRKLKGLETRRELEADLYFTK